MQDAKNNPLYCANFFKGLYLEKAPNNHVKVGACCINKLSPDYDKIDFLDNDYLDQQRQGWFQEPLTACDVCWQQEQDGQISYRQQANIWYENTMPGYDPAAKQLVKLDYNVDPVCNAKCIICSSWFSSLWAQEDQKFDKSIYVRPVHDLKDMQPWRSLNLGHLRRIYFNGGEPMLSQDPELILTEIARVQGGLSGLHFQTNTNGSIKPSPALVDLWRSCQKVDIFVSLDAIGDAFEYIRNPLRWDKVWENILYLGGLDPKIKINLGFTIGVHNIDCFYDAHDFICQYQNQINGFDVGFSRCIGNLALDNASHDLLNLWKSKYKPDPDSSDRMKYFYTFLNNVQGKQDNDIWLQHLERLDQRRNLDWRQALPLLDHHEKAAGPGQALK